ncbi:hypothetical protein NPIL_428301 [Nephila pilipes]|uniref:Uncharacterized protein n=1 Tax=Nephila pilipes TaxID=299642 RepID=A0A8X6M9E2_NEPPI|nr:hypothetical protein NPIL_428301 [Nephila pilipes]
MLWSQKQISYRRNSATARRREIVGATTYGMEKSLQFADELVTATVTANIFVRPNPYGACDDLLLGVTSQLLASQMYDHIEFPPICYKVFYNVVMTLLVLSLENCNGNNEKR